MRFSATFSLLTSILALPLISQADSSPFSLKGNGLELSPFSARERAMGDAGLSLNAKQGQSLTNASRTAFVEKTSFTATMESDLDYLQDKATSNRLTSFAIPSIAMVFKSEYLGSFGLSYYEHFQKNFEYAPPANDNSGLKSLQSVRVEGGIYELSASYAYAINSHWALGATYSYLLGRERIIKTAEFSGDVNLNDAKKLTGDTLWTHSDGNFPTLSLTYRHHYFNLAGSFAFASDLDQEQRKTISTMETPPSQKMTGTYPWFAHLGLTLKLKENQSVVLDYGNSDTTLSKYDWAHSAQQVGLGYEFLGKGNVYDAYYKKLAYRAGLGYQMLQVDQVDHYFVTLGMGLPLGTRGNILDFAVKYGHRGSVQDQKISENYVKMSISLTGVGNWGQNQRRKN